MCHFNTKYQESSESNRMQGASPGFIRVFHAVPNAPNVDVYLNEKLIANNLGYQQYTAYMPIPQGRYQISLFAVGSVDPPILVYCINIEMDARSTVAVVGTLSSISLIAIPDDHPVTPMSDYETDIRFVHLSSDTPAVDITFLTGSILFENLSYQERTSYQTVPSGEYTLQVRTSGTSTVVLVIPDLLLQAKAVYTVYVVGLFEGTPGLEAVSILDGFFT